MKNRVQTAAATVLLIAAISTAALLEFCSIFMGYRILRGSCWRLARHASTLKDFSVAAAAATDYFNPDIEPGAAYKVVLGMPAVLCYALVVLAVCWLSEREGARAMDKKRIEDGCAAEKKKAEQRRTSNQESRQRKKQKKRKGKAGGRGQAPRPLSIFVRDLCSKTVAVHVAQGGRSTVGDLKKAISEKTNLPVQVESLVLPGKRAVFADDALLADCNIGCGSTVTLMLAGGLRGGMGCGPSKPSSDDDGSAYREEVTVYEAGGGTSAAGEGASEVSGPAGGGDKKKGKKKKEKKASTKKEPQGAPVEVSAKVAAAIAKIKVQLVELQADVDKHGAVPSAELSATAARQATDAVGSTLCVIKSLEQQLEEARGNVGHMDHSMNDSTVKPLERDLAAARATLKAAMDVCTTKWNLVIEGPFQDAVDNEDTFASLPMSVPEKGVGSDATMIGVIGAIALKDGVTFTTKQFKGRRGNNAGTADVTESAAPAWMFDAFAEKRVAESTTLVQMILRDVELYDNALSAQVKLPGGAAVVVKLAEATSDDAILNQAVSESSGSTSSTVTVTKAWIKETAAAATASAAAADVPVDSLAYVAHARLAAGPVSITLYEVVSSLLHAHSIDSAELSLLEWSDGTKGCTIEVGIGASVFGGLLPPSLKQFAWKEQQQLGNVGDHDPVEFNRLLQYRPDIEEVDLKECNISD
eukprot:gene12531-7905_t